MKGVMQQLGAVDLASGSPTHVPPSDPTQTLVPEAEAQASAPQAGAASMQQPAASAGATAVPQGAAAVGWCLSVFSHAEEVWVKGQVLSWNSRQGQHNVLYEDGEDEWLRLAKEQVQWHSPKCNIAQRAGLQKGIHCCPLTLTVPCKLPMMHASCASDVLLMCVISIAFHFLILCLTLCQCDAIRCTTSA